MSIITLLCLVEGNTTANAFPVSIDKRKRVGDLKDAIKLKNAPEFDNFPADTLKLCKVEIPSERDDLLSILSLQSRNELKATTGIRKCFPDSPPEEQIHVLVIPPEATKSIDLAISEAKKLFNDYSHDLIKVAENTYKPYSAFIAPENNKYKESIDMKNIPVINGRPNLLPYNLPEEGEKGLTDYDSFKKCVTESLPRSNKIIILGTSGCGKTRLCFESLCHNFGLYLISIPYGVGSSDLQESACWTKDNVADKSVNVAEEIAMQAVISCVVGRLLLLQHLFSVAKDHNVTMVPKSWLMLQLNHIIFRKLQLIFRDVKWLDSADYCDLIIKDLNDRRLLKEIFPVVYDEAQAHTDFLPATFPSAQLHQDKTRAFFSVVVRSLSRSFSLIPEAIICVTGSGLSLLRALQRNEISSKGKELYVPIFNKFCRIETSDELFELVKSIIPLKEEEKEVVLHAIDWLKGRYRWSWTWIHYLISSDDFDPERQLMRLVKNLTTKAEGLPNGEYSIYTGFENLEKHPPDRLINIDCVAILELMKRAFVSYSMTGRPITSDSYDEMDIMNLGFAHIKIIQQQKLTYTIDEPLVLQTAFNYFKKNPDDVWFRRMSHIDFNASMTGLIWEKVVVNFLREKLFESNKALSESEMFRTKTKIRNKKGTRDYKYLPDDFERPPQLLPYGDNCMGRLAVEFTTADNYLEWLRAVAEWEKTGNVPKEFCPICYPPNMAGPDISIAFFFPKAENDMQLDEEYEERKSYILNVQVKLRKKAVMKGSFRTVEPNLMFLDKNRKSNPPKANATLNKIYKDQGWFNRNMKMIVIYPCNPQRKVQYQQTSGASSRKSIIPRVIIDMENASTLFPEDFQVLVEEFKKEIPDDWDCSDVDDESD